MHFCLLPLCSLSYALDLMALLSNQTVSSCGLRPRRPPDPHPITILGCAVTLLRPPSYPLFFFLVRPFHEPKQFIQTYWNRLGRRIRVSRRLLFSFSVPTVFPYSHDPPPGVRHIKLLLHLLRLGSLPDRSLSRSISSSNLFFL